MLSMLSNVVENYFYYVALCHCGSSVSYSLIYSLLANSTNPLLCGSYSSGFEDAKRYSSSLGI